MGYTSQSGHLILRSQAVEGTYQADTGTAGIALLTKSGTLSPKRDLMIPDAEIGGSRDVNDAYLGPASWAGDIQFYARMNSLSTLLYGALGVKGTTSAGAGSAIVKTHTLTGVDDTALPWFSAEQLIANAYECFHFTDVKFNTLHLEIDASGYFMGTVGLVSKKQTAGATPTNPSDPAGDSSIPSIWDNTPLVPGTNITMTYNGVTVPAKSLSMDINNNLEEDDHRLGSFYLGDVTEKRREVTLGAVMRPADSGIFRQALYGLSSATAVGGIATKAPVVITASTYEVIGTSVQVYTATFTLPKVAILPFSVDPSGDDVIQNTLVLRALRPVVATPILTAVVKNGVVIA